MGFGSSALLGLVALIDYLWASGHLHCWVWCLSSRFSMGFRSSALLGLVSIRFSLGFRSSALLGLVSIRFSMGFRSSALLGLVSHLDYLWGSGQVSLLANQAQ